MVCIHSDSFDRELTNSSQIGGAYLAGARFDVAFNELRKGKLFPGLGGEEIVKDFDHAYDPAITHAEL